MDDKTLKFGIVTNPAERIISKVDGYTAIKVIGVDWDGNRLEQDIILDGVTPVQPKGFVDINSITYI